uniref:MAT homeobox alpha 2 protein n=1 Tax=Suhomyces atakaporum TaxID=246088 RepID=A0A3Q9FFI1_9ASCO|nr:MAT homeobox alpha 2 protein [Suhomyces atakaporum]
MGHQIELLKLIELHLKMHITTLCTCPVFDPECMIAEIQEHVSSTRLILRSGSAIDDESKQLLTNINKLIQSLILISKERYNFHSQIFELAKVENDSGLSPFIKYDPNSTKHKFSSNQIKVLEDWYESNSLHPYLDYFSCKDLHSRTGLTIMQVRNWVSNRRRKEKSHNISKELLPFLT